MENPIGEAELRVFYVECENNSTVSYGHIDEDFYDALLDMYEYAIETVLDTPKEEQKAFQIRLKAIMDSQPLTSVGDTLLALVMYIIEHSPISNQLNHQCIIHSSLYPVFLEA